MNEDEPFEGEVESRGHKQIIILALILPVLLTCCLFLVISYFMLQLELGGPLP